MNCVHPIAPAFDGPMLQPKPDSISVIAARIVQRSPKALAAAFHVGTSCGAPWQRGSARSPVRTCGWRPWSARSASARSEPRAAPGADLPGARGAGGPAGALARARPARPAAGDPAGVRGRAVGALAPGAGGGLAVVGDLGRGGPGAVVDGVVPTVPADLVGARAAVEDVVVVAAAERVGTVAALEAVGAAPA